MTRPQDAPLIASLEYQYSELTALCARAERLRADRVPPPTTSWHGSARRAYETAMQGIAVSLDEVVGCLRTAHGNTASAIREVHARA